MHVSPLCKNVEECMLEFQEQTYFQMLQMYDQAQIRYMSYIEGHMYIQ